MKKLLSLTLLLLAGVFFYAFQAPEGLKPGDKAPDFNLRNVDGTMKSFSSYQDAKGFVIVFTCNHCPFSKAYEQRIIDLHREWAPKGYPVVAINPNDAEAVPEDSFEEMQKLAGERKYPFDYLHDSTQSVARAYGAARTPHVFIAEKTSVGNIIRYIGAIDDNSSDASAATKHYVVDVLKALSAGQQPATTFTKAIGCTVKWKKS